MQFQGTNLKQPHPLNHSKKKLKPRQEKIKKKIKFYKNKISSLLTYSRYWNILYISNSSFVNKFIHFKGQFETQKLLRKMIFSYH